MPLNTRRRARCFDLVDALARLDVCDLHARALVGTADHVASIEGEADAANGAGHVGQGALADPVTGVP